MDQILSYVKPELLIVVVVLYFIGAMIKKSENISDKFIPMILGILGVLICGLSGSQEAAMALFTAITQGIIVAGLSTYVNQLIKQSGKEE